MHRTSDWPASPRGRRRLTSVPSGNSPAHFHKPPDLLTEHDVREYLVYLKEECGYCPAH